MIHRPPSSPLFPYTPLFRSSWRQDRVCCARRRARHQARDKSRRTGPWSVRPWAGAIRDRSEEHTSELQSQSNLVCRLLLEKKKDNQHLAVDLAYGLLADDVV